MAVAGRAAIALWRGSRGAYRPIDRDLRIEHVGLGSLERAMSSFETGEMRFTATMARRPGSTSTPIA